MLGQTVGERVDCYKIASFEESFAAVVDAYVVEAEVSGEYAAVVGENVASVGGSDTTLDSSCMAFSFHFGAESTVLSSELYTTAPANRKIRPMITAYLSNMCERFSFSSCA